MRNARPDINTVAQEAGVSIATVHRALVGSGPVSDATRKKVIEVAERLGYRPNRIASSLRSRKTGTLGVVTSGLSGSFYARIVEGIEEAARQRGYRLFLACSHGDAASERELVDALLDSQVEGLIVSPTDPVENRPYFAGIADTGTPLVFVDRDVPGVKAPTVAMDHRMAGEMLGRHLVELGRHRPMFLCLDSRRLKLSSVRERYEGLCAAYAAARLEEPVLLEGELGRPAARFAEATGTSPTFSEMCLFATEEALRPLLSPFPFDAVVAVFDHIAVSTLSVLEQAEIRVPEDVSVVGFDDQDFTEFVTPSLTTIRQPLNRIGETAASMLIECLDRGKRLGVTQTRLMPTLIVRRSCGALSRP